MTRLAEILDQMSAVLNDLKTVMDQEQQHLSMGQINGSQLQWITEQKSSLLATLDYLEQLRRKEPNAANSVDISQRWQEITVKTQQLRQMNQHNGWLLEGQIERKSTGAGNVETASGTDAIWSERSDLNNPSRQ